eukprot:3523957-Pyramimonas_sp.AAC.1
MVVHNLFKEARQLLLDPQRWAKCKNPIAALFLSLHRIGWPWGGVRKVRGDGDQLWDFRVTPSALLSQLAKHWVRICMGRGALHRLPEGDHRIPQGPL